MPEVPHTHGGALLGGPLVGVVVPTFVSASPVSSSGRCYSRSRTAQAGDTFVSIGSQKKQDQPKKLPLDLFWGGSIMITCAVVLRVPRSAEIHTSICSFLEAPVKKKHSLYMYSRVTRRWQSTSPFVWDPAVHFFTVAKPHLILATVSVSTKKPKRRFLSFFSSGPKKFELKWVQNAMVE